jgi:amino-acid N-acetyltransferase
VSVAFAWAGAGDLPAVLELLRRCDLPADLDGAAECLVARQGTMLVGCVALERYGADALLRSLAVGPEQRGEGLGRALVQRITRRARALGARRLWLLTTTAADYFATLGYARVERASAPARLQASAQFASVCPSTAACMARQISRGAHGKAGKAKARKSLRRA